MRGGSATGFFPSPRSGDRSSLGEVGPGSDVSLFWPGPSDAGTGPKVLEFGPGPVVDPPLAPEHFWPGPNEAGIGPKERQNLVKDSPERLSESCEHLIQHNNNGTTVTTSKCPPKEDRKVQRRGLVTDNDEKWWPGCHRYTMHEAPGTETAGTNVTITVCPSSPKLAQRSSLVHDSSDCTTLGPHYQSNKEIFVKICPEDQPTPSPSGGCPTFTETTANGTSTTLVSCSESLPTIALTARQLLELNVPESYRGSLNIAELNIAAHPAIHTLFMRASPIESEVSRYQYLSSPLFEIFGIVAVFMLFLSVALYCFCGRRKRRLARVEDGYMTTPRARISGSNGNELEDSLEKGAVWDTIELCKDEDNEKLAVLTNVEYIGDRN